MKIQWRPILWLSIGIGILIGLWVIGNRLFTSPDTAGNRSQTQLSDAVPDDFIIAGISPGLSSDRVKHILGSPRRLRNEKAPSFQNPSYMTYQSRWSYHGLEIWFLASAAKNSPPPHDGQVIKIIVFQPGFKTYRGIEVGDDVRKVSKRYGPAPISKDGVDYHSDQGDIGFFVKNSAVSRIEIEANID